MSSDFYQAWLAAKEAEREAIERRRAIEDDLLEHLNLPAEEGTHSFNAGAYKVKISQRFNRKVDAEKLREIAIENGLQEHLGALFRWKPELSLPAWKAAGEEITRPLSEAITTTPGRASFSITVETD